MIILGYPGIGKTSFGGKNNTIDLESSCFYVKNKRPVNWFAQYCKVAEHLSKQGYIVFVSCHDSVRNYLKENSKEPLYLIFPSVSLKDEWVKRLENRFLTTGEQKDYRAWKTIQENYKYTITILKNCGIRFYEIQNLDYRLQDIVDYLVMFDDEWN